MRELLQQCLDAFESNWNPDKEKAIAALEAELAKPEKEPMSFQTWRSRQHGDPEEIGFLQALKHAYESGQYSVSPPRKEWVGLSADDLSVCDEDGVILAKYWEAKLRSKNV